MSAFQTAEIGEVLMEKLLTVKEVAKYLKFDVQTIYRKANHRKASKRRIPCLRAGGALRFKISAIDKWMAECKSTRTKKGRKSK
jgi:excisionase family DNA binding protein